MFLTRHIVEVTRARTAYSAAVDDLTKGRARLAEVRADLEVDWGLHWEFKMLQGLCLEKDTGEYVFLRVGSKGYANYHLDTLMRYVCLKKANRNQTKTLKSYLLGAFLIVWPTCLS